MHLERWAHTETAMAVMYKHVATKSDGSIVVNATCAIRDITHNNSQRVGKSVHSSATTLLNIRKSDLRTAQ
jgi:hypothetical protein